jgi:2OG-Fe(II) oxygenase superfamily
VTALQGDLLATCFHTGCQYLVDPAASSERIQLDTSSWVDVVRGWLLGADTLFSELAATLAWGQRRRRMWNQMVDEPRLTCRIGAGAAAPHAALADIRRALVERYQLDFGAIGCNYYRDGHDSVASHRDQELRLLDNTAVAIVTCGARRPFLIRPRGGGTSIDLRPGSGDLLVMGGACQRDWEHGVPKVKACGPRISISLRWAGTAGSGGSS